ncbi:hypothetical protein ACFPIF_13185 [Brevundimonas faecalis]|uniref:hypothetical protein n=1 Tax=Brevundimonas faecalis TaxID=947378 RepID=UPI003605DFAE
MRHVILPVLAALIPVSAAAQQATAVPAQPPAAPAQAGQPARSAFTLDTPIQRLVADPAAKAVLDRELPGLTTHERYEQFKGISLKTLQPFSGGLISDERMRAVEAGLKALG